jgi:ATP-dependent DNA helicase RecQ
MTTNPGQDRLHAALAKHFGFERFKEGQADAVQAALDGRDTVVVMPTGSGKSLCYQLAALMLDGVTVVISPLIALMKDQCDALQARGIPATFINSSLGLNEARERISGVQHGAYKLVYVAPERFRNRRFAEVFQGLAVPLMAVDEAHCISQWGHDFRPDYLRLRRVLQPLRSTRVMALTATATPDVRSDIIENLCLGRDGREPPLSMVHGFRRPNLVLSVSRTATHADKLRRVLEVLKTYPTGIIYCATRKHCETVLAKVKQAGVKAVLYHGGMPDEDRQEVQNRFMSGEVPVVVATNAFGMGVDRADLRSVLHWDVPGSVEAYYQEVGRAGRDGEEAWCELLYNYADVRTQEFFIEGANPTRDDVEAVWKLVQTVCRSGPVTQPVSDWAEALGSGYHEMGVRTAMAMLERGGLLERVMAPGHRVYTTSLAGGASLDIMEEQFERMARKRDRDERKLQAMLAYASTRGCRHGYILSHFGEPFPEQHCGACDQCRRAAPEGTREPTEEEWIILQKVLSCVARMRGRFGVRRVVQVLQGSRAKQVLDWDLDALSTYGLLKGFPEPYVRRVLEELIRDGCAEITAGEYPLVAITPRGREAARREVTPQMVWPAPPIAARAARARPAPAGDGPAAPADTALASVLRAWRMKVSKAAGVPPYTVMNNKTLDAIAAAMPDSLAELEDVPGMGPARVARYGNALLNLIDEHRA